MHYPALYATLSEGVYQIPLSNKVFSCVAISCVFLIFHGYSDHTLVASKVMSISWTKQHQMGPTFEKFSVIMNHLTLLWRRCFYKIIRESVRFVTKFIVWRNKASFLHPIYLSNFSSFSS